MEEHNLDKKPPQVYSHQHKYIGRFLDLMEAHHYKYHDDLKTMEECLCQYEYALTWPSNRLTLQVQCFKCGEHINFMDAKGSIS